MSTAFAHDPEWKALWLSWRKASGLTQEQAAQIVGLTVHAIRQWEIGRRSPYWHKRQKILFKMSDHNPQWSDKEAM